MFFLVKKFLFSLFCPSIKLNKIYPILKEEVKSPTGKPSSIKVDIMAKKWLDPLIICFGHDRGSFFEILQKRHLKQFNFTQEELLLIATDNLRKKKPSIQKTNFGGWGVLAGGSYEAGTVLLPELWSNMAEKLNDNLVVSVSNRDLVLFVPESDKKQVEELKKVAQKLYSTGDHPLSNNLYFYDRFSGQWQVFT